MYSVVSVLFQVSDQASFCIAQFYWDSLSNPSHRSACHSQWNNWKWTMNLYLHRNRATCRRLQCRTPISFVFNLNEKFCWGRLFPAYIWLACACVWRVCVCAFACFATYSCFPFSLLVSALRWLHSKLDDRSRHDKSCNAMMVCYLLAAQLFFNDLSV